jgi:glycosyltransferase involved in cell wall biosynthesis
VTSYIQPMPLFSIIIAVYNDWTALDSCLLSLSQQTAGPDFEVIVVDDGSYDEAPEGIRQWVDRLPLTIVRQSHAGISTARNRGVRTSKGSVLLFVDADCRLQPNCLAALGSTITASPTHNNFQLHLIGDRRGMVGRAEELRLITLQNHLLQPNGCIRYLNTAGFAIRRSHVDVERGLFDSSALRAEDTLLLAGLIQRGELPFFVTDAMVQHNVPLSLLQCFRKDIRSALLEGKTFDLIASRGIRIRMSNRERLGLLRSMWKTSKQPAIGRSAWFALTARQSLQRVTSLLFPLFRNRYTSRTANPS